MTSANYFTSLPLKPELLKALQLIQYNEMTPIQSISLPLILDGFDIVGKAQTGSGKTAAFALGILSKIDIKKLTPQALILCPTRELADQVSNEIRRLAMFIDNVKIVAIYGGKAEYFQIKSLEHGVHIIVGTPGRVLKLLKNGKLILSNILTLILDEADRMLDMGFIDDIKQIESYIPKSRQTLLYSATFPEAIINLGNSFQKDPKLIDIATDNLDQKIEQYFIRLENHTEKLFALQKVLNKFNPKSTIIFCKTKELTIKVAEALSNNGIEALALNGDMEQRDRTLVVTKFSNGSANIIVATDVAARGIDIKDLSLVINFDLPSTVEMYTHRIGRTGRAEKTGHAITFYVPHEKEKIEQIRSETNFEIKSSSIESFNTSESFSRFAEMVTLFFAGGKKDKLRKSDFLGALVQDGGIPPENVGNISIFDSLTYVAINKRSFNLVNKFIKQGKIKGRKYRAGQC